MIDDKLCLNCNFAVEGKFCANCGQKTSTKRLNFGTVTHDFIHVLTHADKGVFSFAKEIAYKPGIIAKDYISGKRKKYFNPISFFIIILGLYTYVVADLNSEFMTTNASNLNIDATNSNLDPEKAQMIQKKSQQVMEFFFHYAKIFAFLMLPLSALFSLLYFKKQKYNYTEHFIVDTIRYSAALLITGLMYVINLTGVFSYQFSTVLGLLISLAYFLLAYFQFFTGSSKWWRLIGGTLVLISSYIVFIMVIIIFILISIRLGILKLS